ncbi:MAG: hypothetical protein JO213_13850 [Alphaproteobacteria bacterium]|nr:hypothetical protein [Alphaproteobacteria bacterium]
MISRRFGAMLLVVAAPLLVAARYDGEPPFEKAVQTSTVKLGSADTQPPSEKEIRCFYFARLMVKELDEQDIGDTEISYNITGPGQTVPDCAAKPIPGERKLEVEESYFWGVAADKLFLIDADGANGTIGFRVYEPQSSRELFHDTIKLDTRLRDVTQNAGKLHLSYTRAVTGSCSVMTGGETCWRAITRKMQMPESPPPDCRAGYEAALRRAAEEACRDEGGDKAQCLDRETKERSTGWDAAPSVVSFDVDVTISAKDEAARTYTGGPVACWPAD